MPETPSIVISPEQQSSEWHLPSGIEELTEPQSRGEILASYGQFKQQSAEFHRMKMEMGWFDPEGRENHANLTDEVWNNYVEQYRIIDQSIEYYGRLMRGRSRAMIAEFDGVPEYRIEINHDTGETTFEPVHTSSTTPDQGAMRSPGFRLKHQISGLFDRRSRSPSQQRSIFSTEHS